MTTADVSLAVPQTAPPGSLARRLSILRTHAAMFGYVNLLRSALAAVISPDYSRESWDRKFGTDTSRLSLIESQMPREAMSEAVDYEPAHVQTLRHVFSSLPFNVRDFAMLDIGCGKGRTLLVASRWYPFRSITGVELSPVTAQIAEANVIRYTAREKAMCKAVFVRCENGTSCQIPPGDVLVVMYNPFFGQTFERCIEHLHREAVAHPERQMWLAYINPWNCEEYLASTGYFQQVADYRVIPRTWAWSLWRHV